MFPGKRKTKSGRDTNAKPHIEAEQVVPRPDHVLVAKDTSSLTEQFSRNPRNRRFFKIGGALLLAMIALSGYLAYDRWLAKEPAPIVGGLSAEQLKIKDTTSVEDVVQRYGKDYDTRSKEVQSKKYTEWDKATLDKAYFSLLYVDKAGLFTQVYDTLAQIEGAKMNGLNIDDNSYGITQAERDAIKKRADDERGRIP